jgi:hypothetical protein
MLAGTHEEVPVTTVDARELDTLMWGPLRATFPSFAEEIELARYVRQVLADSPCKAVQIEPHRDASGRPSTHVFDVFFVRDSSQVD